MNGDSTQVNVALQECVGSEFRMIPVQRNFVGRTRNSDFKNSGKIREEHPSAILSQIGGMGLNKTRCIDGLMHAVIVTMIR